MPAGPRSPVRGEAGLVPPPLRHDRKVHVALSRKFFNDAPLAPGARGEVLTAAGDWADPGYSVGTAWWHSRVRPFAAAGALPWRPRTLFARVFADGFDPAGIDAHFAAIDAGGWAVGAWSQATGGDHELAWANLPVASVSVETGVAAYTIDGVESVLSQMNLTTPTPDPRPVGEYAVFMAGRMSELFGVSGTTFASPSVTIAARPGFTIAQSSTPSGGGFEYTVAARNDAEAAAWRDLYDRLAATAYRLTWKWLVWVPPADAGFAALMTPDAMNDLLTGGAAELVTATDATEAAFAARAATELDSFLSAVVG